MQSSFINCALSVHYSLGHFLYSVWDNVFLLPPNHSELDALKIIKQIHQCLHQCQCVYQGLIYVRAVILEK